MSLGRGNLNPVLVQRPFNHIFEYKLKIIHAENASYGPDQ